MVQGVEVLVKYLHGMRAPRVPEGRHSASRVQRTRLRAVRSGRWREGLTCTCTPFSRSTSFGITPDLASFTGGASFTFSSTVVGRSAARSSNVPAVQHKMQLGWRCGNAEWPGHWRGDGCSSKFRAGSGVTVLNCSGWDARSPSAAPRPPPACSG
jgi:hypothetical protein